jgi:hypothetical protein
MVRKADRAVAQGLVYFLYFFRRILSVRNICVAMGIDLVKATAFGEKFLHNSTSFLSDTKIIAVFDPFVKNWKSHLFSDCTCFREKEVL